MTEVSGVITRSDRPRVARKQDLGLSPLMIYTCQQVLIMDHEIMASGWEGIGKGQGMDKEGLQSVLPSIDGVDCISAYCKRHACVGLFLISQSVSQFTYISTNEAQQCGIPDESLVALTRRRETESCMLPSSDRCRSFIQCPVDGAGNHQCGKFPSSARKENSYISKSSR